MTAARRLESDERDVGNALPLLRSVLSKTLLEALISLNPASVVDLVRKWTARPHVSNDEVDMEAWLGEAEALARELLLFTPSFSGVRPIDRRARAAAAEGGDSARASALAAKAEFRLFRILDQERKFIYRARDLATGEIFRLFEDYLSTNALGLDVAARLCAVPEDLRVMIGPLIPIGRALLSTAENYLAVGKGVGAGQRRAALVYRDYIRNGALLGLSFGLAPRRAPVLLSRPDDELQALVEAARDRDQQPEFTADALAGLRELSSATRIVSALVSFVETRAGGYDEVAALYRSAAHVMMETLHRRGRVGSGEARPLEIMRGAFATQVEAKKLSPEAMALFEELALAIAGRAEPKAKTSDDLDRVIERIRGLRAKTTQQGCTEHEALLAAEKVAQLLERYGLSLSEIEMRKQACEGFGVDTGRRKREPIDRCAPTVGDFCDCRVWGETGPTGSIRHVYFGLPADVEAARYLHDLVGVAFETETAAFRRGPFYTATPSPQRRGAVTSFQIGLADGIIAKLAKLKADRRAATAKSTGRDLMPIKTSILDEEMEKLGLAFTSRRSTRRKVVTAAYTEGKSAGARFEVNAKIA